MRLLSRVYTLVIWAVVIWTLVAGIQGISAGRFGSLIIAPVLFTALLSIFARLSTDAICDWGDGRRWNKGTTLGLIEGIAVVGAAAAWILWLRPA
jgi:hypothetical protein